MHRMRDTYFIRTTHMCDCDYDSKRLCVWVTIEFPLLRFPSKCASISLCLRRRRNFELEDHFTFANAKHISIRLVSDVYNAYIAQFIVTSV